MSVSQRPNGQWCVRWREGGRGSKMHQQTTGVGRDGKEAALELDALLKRNKRLGGLVDLSDGTDLFSDYILEWWQWKKPGLEAKGEKYYRWLITNYLEPEMGDMQLRHITPANVEDLFDSLAQRGVSDNTRRRAMGLLQQIMSRAVRQDKISTNPVREVPRPRQSIAEPVRRVVPVEIIEKMRYDLLAIGGEDEALLLTLMAYAGLRPQEALALTFGDVRKNVIVVNRKMTIEGVKDSTKTKRGRDIDKAYGVVIGEVNEARLRKGMPSDDHPVLARPSGAQWSTDDFNNWRKRRYHLMAKQHELESRKPYDLRHTFASLLLSDGWSLTEVADQLGHSPMVCSQVYAHVIKELDHPDERKPSIEVIQGFRSGEEKRRVG